MAGDVPETTEPAPEPPSSESPSSSDGTEAGEITEPSPEAPPLPDEALPESAAGDDSAPPLPSESVPGAEAADDGWDFRWDYVSQRYIFFNRLTGQEQFENPRIPSAADPTSAPPALNGTDDAAPPGLPAPPVITGYNPAIHGDYDPNAWYAKSNQDPAAFHNAHDAAAPPDASDMYEATAMFNRFTGQYETSGPGKHSDEAKSHRQQNAYFDVDAAANAHDGRSLKAERSGKKVSKADLKAFKEKRKARKEEKRRAWLRD
jgi:hypothetical protein